MILDLLKNPSYVNFVYLLFTILRSTYYMLCYVALGMWTTTKILSSLSLLESNRSYLSSKLYNICHARLNQLYSTATGSLTSIIWSRLSGYFTAVMHLYVHRAPVYKVGNLLVITINLISLKAGQTHMIFT